MAHIIKYCIFNGTEIITFVTIPFAPATTIFPNKLAVHLTDLKKYYSYLYYYQNSFFGPGSNA